MRILVTGGAGYIGSHTLVEVLAAGHEAHVVDNLVNASPVALDRVRQITNRGFGFTRADLRDAGAMRALVAETRPEAVIHFAGLKAVGESVADPLGYFDNNVAGTLALLRALVESDCRRFVFSSSATVYGDPDYLPIDEAHPRRATNPYGRTKLQVEEILEDLARADPSWSIALLRYFNPVGAHASGWMGEDPAGIPNNLMPFIAQVAVGRRAALNVFGTDYPTPDGTGVRDYIHVTDLARAHLAAVDWTAADGDGTGGDGTGGDGTGADGTGGAGTGAAGIGGAGTGGAGTGGAGTGGAGPGRGCEAFNLGTGAGTSVLEMARAFGAAAGREIPLNLAPRRPGDVASCYADAGKARAVLGWNARLGLAEMCASSWNWQSNNPEGYPDGA